MSDEHCDSNCLSTPLSADSAAAALCAATVEAFQHFSIYCPALEQVVALSMPRVGNEDDHTDDFRGGRMVCC